MGIDRVKYVLYQIIVNSQVKEVSRLKYFTTKKITNELQDKIISNDRYFDKNLTIFTELMYFSMDLLSFKPIL